MPPVRAGDGQLTCGRLTLRHPALRGDGTSPAGVELGHLVFDVPGELADRAAAEAELAARTTGRRSMLVADDDDLDRAVALIVDTLAAD